jgi:molybdate transport system substrate-binding protein
MNDIVRVLSTLAVKSAVQALVEPYYRATGCRIDADFAPTQTLAARLRGGERADLLILTREGLQGFSDDGAVIAASCVDLARSYVGIAVKVGAPHPDIADASALRSALLAARAVAYSRIGASGILFASLIERLGIAAEINARAVILPSGLTAERLVTGEADLAVQQISELKQVDGIEVVGPIPHPLQTPAVFSAGLVAASPRREQAGHLLRHLASAAFAATLRDAGLEP